MTLTDYLTCTNRPPAITVNEPASGFLMTPERDLHAIWQSSTGWTIPIDNGPATASPGQSGSPDTPPITVVVRFPGWASKAPGPDFRDAILVGPSGELRGDVEIHRDARDWYRHGHSADPRYGNVVLHVYGGSPSGWSDDLRSANAATVAIPRYVLNLAQTRGLDLTPSRVADFPCGGTRPSDRLHDLGLSRFAKREAILAARLNAVSGIGAHDQVAWEEIAIALGYGGNEAPMERCARIATLRRVRSVHMSFENSGLGEAASEAYLLGTGGFLTGARHASEATPLGFQMAHAQSLWTQIDGTSGKSVAADPIPLIAWSKTSVRPENSPHRRLSALVRIMSSWPGGQQPTESADHGVLRSGHIARVGQQASDAMIARVAAIVEFRSRSANTKRESVHGDLAGLVTVKPSPSQPALVGPARAADIVVNVLLPLLSAWGLVTGNRDLSEAAREVYATHPALASNWITREVGRRIGLGGRGEPTVRRASVQQGMIGLWEGPCRPLACTECPIGRVAPSQMSTLNVDWPNAGANVDAGGASG